MATPPGYRQNLPVVALCLLAFSLPFPFIYGAVGVALATVTLIGFRGKELFRNYRQRPGLWGWTALYLWHVCSWFWSVDKAQANADLSTKLSLLLLPIVIGSSELVSRRNLQKVVFAFIAGLAVVAVGCSWLAWQRYGVNHDLNTLFYHELVQGLEANAVYVGWYTLTALLFLLLEPVVIPFFKKLWLRLSLVLVLLPFFLMLTARTPILFFVGLGLPVALLLSFRKQTDRANRVLVWVTVGAMAASAIVAFRNPVIQSRFGELRKSKPELSFLKHYQGEDHQFGNLNVRLFLWRVGAECMATDPTVLVVGTGIGDAHTVTNARIRQLGITPMEADAPNRHPFYDINLHNTFIQIALMTGVVGLLLLLLAVSAQVWMAARHFRSYPFDLMFHIGSLLFMMQEAIFQTQAGVIFYLTICLLLLDWSYNRRMVSQ